jgi:chaperone required for assembly of F1-ATPase
MMEHIFDYIRQERKYQIEKWGTRADDEINTPMDWVGYIAHYSTNWMSGGFRPYPEEVIQKFRKSMIKVATLAVAAIAWSERLLDGEISRPDVLKDR